MSITRRTLAFSAAALALLPSAGPASGQSGRQKRVRGDAVWQGFNEQIFGVNGQILVRGIAASKK